MTGSTFSVALLTILNAVFSHAEGVDVDSNKGWTASREQVEALTKRRPEINYREDKVPEYTLPGLLVMCNGTQVTDARTWQTKRRPEILELFRKHVYGRAPVDQPKETTYQRISKGTRWSGDSQTGANQYCRSERATEHDDVDLPTQFSQKASSDFSAAEPSRPEFDRLDSQDQASLLACRADYRARLRHRCDSGDGFRTG